MSSMIVKKLRLQRGWSQEQLAHMSGLSIRTIQRIERGQKAGIESLKSLAAVFEVDFSKLTEDAEMMNDVKYKTPEQLTAEEQQAFDYVRELKGFYGHLATYVVVTAALFMINYLATPSYIWAWWSAFGWGIGVISHGFHVFNEYEVFGAAWERRQVEKRLGRKL